MLSMVSSVTSALILLLFLVVVLHESGIMKVVSDPILSNTEVYLIPLLVLKIIQLHDKTLYTLSGLHKGKYSIFSEVKVISMAMHHFTICRAVSALIGTIALNRAPGWSYLLSAVQVHTTTQCMFYREQEDLHLLMPALMSSL